VQETEQVSQLLGDIYDASLDPALWPQVLKNISGFMRVSAVNLFAQDAMKRAPNVFYVHGPRSDLHPVVLRQIHQNESRCFRPPLFFEVGQIIAEDDVLPRSQLRNTRFFKERVEPQGYVDSLATILEKSAVSCAVLSACATSGTAWRRAIPPIHGIRSAARASSAADRQGHRPTQGRRGCNGGHARRALPPACFLVDRTGRIVHANVSGHAMLAAGNLLRAAGPRLSIVAPRPSRRCEMPSPRPKEAILPSASGGIAIAFLGSEGSPYVAHVLPLTAGNRRRAGANHGAVAVVFVRQATLDGSTPFETIARHFQLTQADCASCSPPWKSAGCRKIAPVLGIRRAR